jgi:UDP-glucose 4-epimerase
MTSQHSSLFWIIGSGGLLGSRLRAAISRDVPGAKCWEPPIGALSWNAPTHLKGELVECAKQFGRAVLGQPNGSAWGVVWTAGAGVIGTTEQVLAAETSTIELVLSLIHAYLPHSEPHSSLVFLASSAGGVYGNCPDQTITEHSACRPISPYGVNKQRQEELFHSWTQDHPHVTCRIGRISNLYGAGQNLSKPQGLISHISKCLIWQQPIHVYVPLDTIRDYLHVDDCAKQIAKCMSDWVRACPERAASRGSIVKIFAAEEPTSVAEIIGEFTKLASRRHPRVICSPNALGLQQPRRLLFRSIVPPIVTGLRKTTLQVGLDQLHRHQMGLYRRGRLPPTIAK